MTRKEGRAKSITIGLMLREKYYETEKWRITDLATMSSKHDFIMDLDFFKSEILSFPFLSKFVYFLDEQRGDWKQYRDLIVAVALQF